MVRCLDFSKALELLKEGHRLTRHGWNGKAMYLVLIKGEHVANAIHEHYPNLDDYGVYPEWHEKGRVLPVRDAIYMKTVDNELVPWIASQTDLLAMDWQTISSSEA